MLGQHLFGAVERVWLPNATAVPVQVVRALVVVRTTLATLHVLLLVVVLLLGRVVPRIRSTTHNGIATPTAHAPIAVVVVIIIVVMIVILSVVVVIVMATTTAAHLNWEIGEAEQHVSNTHEERPRQRS